MTFEDGEDIKPTKPTLCLLTMNKMGIGDALKSLLLEAQHQGRLTGGIYESAQHLEENPENVMLCILPDIPTVGDISLNIHFTLIEAFCWENDINLIKVDCADKLSKLFSTSTSLTTSKPVNDNDIKSGRTPINDFNCLLVEFPHESTTQAEEDVVEFCKNTSDFTPYPVIELPV